MDGPGGGISERTTKMTGDLKSGVRRVARGFGFYLVHGLIAVIPLAVTIWVIVWLFNLLDGMLAPALDWLLGRHIPGLGFAVIFLAILFIGVFATEVGDHRVFQFFVSQILRIPGLATVYGSTKEILDSLGNAGKGKFMEVIFLEYPRKGIYTVAFVTSKARDKSGKTYLNVFVPTAPNPVGGFVQIVCESDVIHSPMTVTEAMKLLVSAGRVSREDIGDVLEALCAKDDADKSCEGGPPPADTA